LSKRLILTAFGPFGDFAVNPSAEVLAVLEAEGYGVEGWDLSFATVPVCYREVESFPKKVQAEPPDLLIHLGVATGSEKMRLEMCAVNEAFGPDVEGVDPAGAPLGCGPRELRTGMDRSVLEEFQSAHSEAVCFSEDAGRYLCNALYYQSLRYLGEPLGTACLFVHIADPRCDHETCSIPHQAECVRELLRALGDR
jgi:pyroglutamyl-peptidase